MEQWKRNFAEKLKSAQTSWAKQFDQALDTHVTPAFEQISEFVKNHGFTASTPMQREDRRTYKFELAENAYILMIFSVSEICEFELRHEVFVPGQDPVFTKSNERIVDISEAWAVQKFQTALDAFVEHLSGEETAVESPAAAEEELAVV